jgi:hypothetical protein
MWSYGKSKELTFKQLYGGVFDNYKHIEFFSKVDKYVRELWDKFQSEGEITCPVFKLCIQKGYVRKYESTKII